MPRQTKPKITQHHTKDAKMTIRVKTSDLAANPLISQEHFSQAPFTEYVFVRSISELIASGRAKPITVYTSNNIAKVSMWDAKEILEVLTKHGIASEQMLLIRELKGTTTPTETNLGSILLERLPKFLSRVVPWIIEDERRYLVITKGVRTAFKDHRQNVLRAAQGDVVLMMDSEEEAITIKLKHGGTVFDMHELRGQR